MGELRRSLRARGLWLGVLVRRCACGRGCQTIWQKAPPLPHRPWRRSQILAQGRSPSIYDCGQGPFTNLAQCSKAYPRFV
ncbi:hypothetical protein BAUCODRAFT_514172 [Baudoinia panamericana UAMH 10762]|uniref:Secreted protein n=1 Tax=Baudoinia panamericana (strain UAMH 10762) TaxID=717646 RepID=M2MWX5_BAUPA|nr:uncharacterized protein BAUCODRAFT_514172 [Baudoinia panamericana UAMH 10762]EMC96033.1 hypothetical protein BAUCODRAFT_514172 [Baudoinia panamericana UAMH 10762]